MNAHVVASETVVRVDVVVSDVPLSLLYNGQPSAADLVRLLYTRGGTPATADTQWVITATVEYPAVEEGGFRWARTYRAERGSMPVWLEDLVASYHPGRVEAPGGEVR